jgi:VWFA-related protein
MSFLVLFTVLAQQPQERAVFSSRTELVALHVSVIDRESGFVSGLPREAFTVYEDGRPQSVVLFENTDNPVTVGLVIDNSGSMGRMRKTVIAAGMAFAHASHPDDELFAVHFNERVWRGLPASRPFTNDREELRAALLRSTARGQTALFDAVLDGLVHLGTADRRKKALVVISDGGDNASRARFEEVLNKALRMNALIYSIGLYDQYDRDANPKLLRRLAESTGAEAFFPRKPNDVTSILERIARDIRSGYTLGYVPAIGHDRPGYRAIRVEVRAADRKKLSVRARSGYLAGQTDGGDSR